MRRGRFPRCAAEVASGGVARPRTAALDGARDGHNVVGAGDQRLGELALRHGLRCARANCDRLALRPARYPPLAAIGGTGDSGRLEEGCRAVAWRPRRQVPGRQQVGLGVGRDGYACGIEDRSTLRLACQRLDRWVGDGVHLRVWPAVAAPQVQASVDLGRAP